jgi:Domain of unknown function (DUF1844)
MSDDKKSFTVNDRRHFTAEGETRGEDTPRDEATAASAPAATAEPQPRHTDAAGPERGEEGQRPALDFGGLLLSLGAQASLLLGMAGEDDEAPPDLQGAQAIIALLETLREKTEGRRTEDEDRILQAILYELRMAYVSRARAGGA